MGLFNKLNYKNTTLTIRGSSWASRGQIPPFLLNFELSRWGTCQPSVARLPFKSWGIKSRVHLASRTTPPYLGCSQAATQHANSCLGPPQGRFGWYFWCRYQTFWTFVLHTYLRSFYKFCTSFDTSKPSPNTGGQLVRIS